MDHYEGTLDENYEFSGTGTIQFENGAIYEGEWNNGYRHGFGRAKFKNGTSYEGRWWDGDFKGFGRFTYENGDYEEGEWIEYGNKFGIHNCYDKNGRLIRKETWKLLEENEETYGGYTCCTKLVEIL